MSKFFRVVSRQRGVSGGAAEGVGGSRSVEEGNLRGGETSGRRELA